MGTYRDVSWSGQRERERQLTETPPIHGEVAKCARDEWSKRCRPGTRQDFEAQDSCVIETSIRPCCADSKMSTITLFEGRILKIFEGRIASTYGKRKLSD